MSLLIEQVEKIMTSKKYIKTILEIKIKWLVKYCNHFVFLKLIF